MRIALWSLGLLTLAPVAAPAAEPRRVLIVHAFGHAYSPWSDMAGSFLGHVSRHPHRK